MLAKAVIIARQDRIEKDTGDSCNRQSSQRNRCTCYMKGKSVGKAQTTYKDNTCNDQVS